MIKSRGVRRVSLRAKVCGVFSGLLLASAIVILSLPAYRTESVSYNANADISSMSSTAAIAASEEHLVTDDPAGAALLARQALAKFPISSEALRTAAIAELARGHSNYAYALLSQAAALGWRDQLSQIWLARAQLASGDYPAAASRLDAALRVSPNSLSLFDTIDGIVIGSPIVPSFVRRMMLNPDWRASYLSYVNGKNFKFRIDLVRRLNSLGSPPGRKELLSIVHPLFGTGRVAEARMLWFQTLREKPGNLNDPHLRAASASGAGPFDWRLLQVLGATAEPDVNGDGGLQIRTDGQASGVLATQIVTLSPGTHRFAYQGTADQRQHVFQWRIACMPSGKTLLARVEVIAHNYSLVVPPSECSYQTIELAVTSDPSGAGEQALITKVELE